MTHQALHKTLSPYHSRVAEEMGCSPQSQCSPLTFAIAQNLCQSVPGLRIPQILLYSFNHAAYNLSKSKTPPVPDHLLTVYKVLQFRQFEYTHVVSNIVMDQASAERVLLVEVSLPPFTCWPAMHCCTALRCQSVPSGTTFRGPITAFARAMLPEKVLWLGRLCY